MLDYYGSIIKTEQDNDTELIQHFKSRCNESYIKSILYDLKKEGILLKEYSVSGWMVFHGQNIHDIISKQINYKLQQSEKKFKFIYCYNKLFNDIDVCRLICDRL